MPTVPTDRDAMAERVGVLLARRAELARLGLGLPPAERMELARLLFRLGWTRQMARGEAAVSGQFARKADAVVRYANKTRRYALKLGPGVQSRHTTGEAVFTHPYTNEAGQKLGVVRVVPRNDGRTLHVDWAGPEDVAAGGEANTLGHAAVRDLRDQLTAMYPGAKFLTGIRAGGARKANPERTVVGIPGRMARLAGAVRRYAGDFSPRVTALVDAVLKNTKKRTVGTPDLNAISVLGDALQENGNHALGQAASHHATVMGGRSVPFSSLSGDVLDSVSNAEGTHRVIGRHGKDRSGNPVIWVSVSRWKKVPLDNGNTRLDKDKSHEFAVPAGAVKLARSTRPRKYAKIDSHTPVHPLVEGFPIAHALRHLANDPKNSSNVRDLAALALTGKAKYEPAPRPEGHPEALWALHDALRDEGHPAAEWYNWMSAGDKVLLDAHTHKAMHELAANRRAANPRADHYTTDHSNPGGMIPRWEFSPEGAAVRISPAHEVLNPGSTQELQYVRDRVAQLKPGTPPEDIDESIKRHAVRARYKWYQRNLPGGEGQLGMEKRAVGPHVPNPSVVIDEKAARYARFRRAAVGVLRYASPGDTKPIAVSGFDVEPSLFPQERDALIGGKQSTRDAFRKAAAAGIADRPGLLPGVSELKALAEVGSPVKGSYADAGRTMTKLLGDPRDAHRWTVANAILSAQTGWEAHTAGATEALAAWHEAGRPTRARQLNALFGETARNPRGGLFITRRGTYKGPDTLTGHKVEALKRVFAMGDDFPGVEWGLISEGSFKTPNFGKAFVDPNGVPIDTHMAKLVVPGGKFAHSRIHKIAADVGGDPTGLLDAQKAVISKPAATLAYKTLVAKAASDLGWEPREVQEAAWVAALAVMTAKHLGAGPRAGSILRKLNRKAIQAGWSLNTVLKRPEVVRDLGRLGISRRKVLSAIAESEKRLPAGVGRPHTSDAPALESAALRLPGEVAPAAEPIARQLSRAAAGVRKYAHRRTDFIEALRQIRASNNLQSLRQVVDALNLGRTDAVPALHDTVHGSVPGLSVAVYNPVKPELLHAAAAKMALAANQPGAAVFHVRPGGSDHLWRFRQAGSGQDIRARLDRAGIADRILVPSDKAYDVLVPDPGRRNAAAVRAYAKSAGVKLQGSPGFFKVAGSQDQGQARDTFRKKVVAAEQPGG